MLEENELIALIKSTFGFGILPRPEIVISDSCEHGCFEDAANTFPKTREEASIEDLEHCAVHALFLNEEAFRYLFPAFMIAGLNQSKGKESAELTSFCITGNVKDIEKRFTSFSVAERSAIYEYLQVITENNMHMTAKDVARKLKFWKDFCEFPS
ncbi:MAG TPA: DUF6714 family protein [Drouetiella sp.]